MSLRGKRRSNRWALSVLATRGHIRPQSLDFIRFEQVAPRRHGVLALRYRGEEPLALITRELSQIGCALRIGHARAVACGTMSCIHFRAALDLLGLERILCRCGDRKGEQRADEDCFLQPCRFNRAKGQTSIRTRPAGSSPQSPSLPKFRRRGPTAR